VLSTGSTEVDMRVDQSWEDHFAPFSKPN